MVQADLLVAKIARARRFANAVGGVADRERFEAMVVSASWMRSPFFRGSRLYS